MAHQSVEPQASKARVVG